MDLTEITQFVGNMTYAAQALMALLGAFYVIVIWRRIAQLRFRSESEQTAFLDAVDLNLAVGNFDEASRHCDGDPRAVPRLASMAISHRRIGSSKVRAMVIDRFQRDVLADLEHRLSWVDTVIKSEPMLGLYGTVLGMMSAFGKLGSGEKVDPTMLAEDISLALITTAVGLSIAIPLIICKASITVRIRKLEDLVGAGMTRFLEDLKAASNPAAPREP
ncbi:MAG: MotA/TolQ/ExbB proton channel family protein [Pirellulales bacterium]